MSLIYPDPNWPGDQQIWPGNVSGSNAMSSSFTGSNTPLPPFSGSYMTVGNPNWPGDQQAWPGVTVVPNKTVTSSMYR